MAAVTSGESAVVGRRERKKRETRLALSQQTIRLCIEHGWHNVTVEDVARAADVSVRTFHNYFSSKAEAVAARHLDRMLRVVAELRARSATEPLWDSIAGAVQAQFAQAPDRAAVPTGDPGWMDSLRVILAEPAVRGEFHKVDARVRDELAEAIAERTGTDVAHDVYPTLVAAVVSAATGAAVGHWLRTDPTSSLDRLLDDAFTRVTTGLPPP